MMREGSAPLLDLKMVAAASDLYHADEDDNKAATVNNEGSRRSFVLSSAGPKTAPSTARKSVKNNNRRPERLQNSSSSPSSFTDDLRSKLIDISRQKSHLTEKKSANLLDGNFDEKRFQHRRRRRTHSFKK